MPSQYKDDFSTDTSHKHTLPRAYMLAVRQHSVLPVVAKKTHNVMFAVVQRSLQVAHPGLDAGLFVVVLRLFAFFLGCVLCFLLVSFQLLRLVAVLLSILGISVLRLSILFFILHSVHAVHSILLRLSVLVRLLRLSRSKRQTTDVQKITSLTISSELRGIAYAYVASRLRRIRRLLVVVLLTVGDVPQVPLPDVYEHRVCG